MDAVDATVIGSGPNGLAAAVYLASEGFSVRVFEASETPGGGARSAELTLPGFLHDVCSAVHPLGRASPYLATLPLARFGLEWVDPPSPLAHPLDDGTAVVLDGSLETTAGRLGADAAAYRRLLGPFVRNFDALARQILGPPRLPRHPLLLGRFSMQALRPAGRLARAVFTDPASRALFAGAAGHSILPLSAPFTSAFGLMLLGAGHAVGWPIAAGGSQKIVDALAAHLGELGGEIVTGHRITSLEEAGQSRAFLFDTSPREMAAAAGSRLPARYLRRLEAFRHGPGVFKVDYALSEPVPWRARGCARSATLHLGGTLEEIEESEAGPSRGVHPERPLVLAAQPSLFDRTRAPEGRHVLWAYCHVPAGSDVDMTARIDSQIERFAPGFRDVVLARHSMTAADFAAYNSNYAGGDIAGGSHGGLQALFRPVVSLSPYKTPARGIFICSASTPPGAGVHGMCGYWGARAAASFLRTGR